MFMPHGLQEPGRQQNAAALVLQTAIISGFPFIKPVNLL
jgi:hypothetical protein